jgi:hypothetical protein
MKPSKCEKHQNYKYIRFCPFCHVQDERDKYRTALDSIASINKPRHETEEYWLNVPHAQCAIVLATDTKIAREALK